MNWETDDCPLCNLDLEKTRELFNNRYTFIILSNPALVRGHCLVIPRRHVERLDELYPDERDDLWFQVEKMYTKLLKIYDSGCDVRHNYRPFQRQTSLKVNHLHVHLQPRTNVDELYQKCQIYEIDIFRRLCEEELDKLEEEILGGKR